MMVCSRDCVLSSPRALVLSCSHEFMVSGSAAVMPSCYRASKLSYRKEPGNALLFFHWLLVSSALTPSPALYSPQAKAYPPSVIILSYSHTVILLYSLALILPYSHAVMLFCFPARRVSRSRAFVPRWSQDLMCSCSQAFMLSLSRAIVLSCSYPFADSIVNIDGSQAAINMHPAQHSRRAREACK